MHDFHKNGGFLLFPLNSFNWNEHKKKDNRHIENIQSENERQSYIKFFDAQLKNSSICTDVRTQKEQ